MRLPDRIERAIRELEAEVDRRPGQHAGNARLHSLRYAVEDFMREIRVNYLGARTPAKPMYKDPLTLDEQAQRDAT